jgi:anti-sigma factor RsiW
MRCDRSSAPSRSESSVTDSRESLAHPDLTGYIFGLTGSEERQAVLAHLRQCQACARALEELGKLPDLMSAAAPAAACRRPWSNARSTR